MIKKTYGIISIPAVLLDTDGAEAENGDRKTPRKNSQLDDVT